MTSWAVVALMLWSGAVHTSASQQPWPCREKPVEPCVKRHGRFSSQNGIPYTIWIVGTTRRIAVANAEAALPQVARKYLENTSENHSYIFGDFDICPVEMDVPGHMRLACVVGAEKLVVQPLRRQRPAFRLLSTWPIDARP